MKRLYILCFLLCSVGITKAQTIKPYIAIIKTDSGKVKGILYTANADYLVVDAGNGFKTIKTSIIKSVKIREIKKEYQVKKLVKYDPYSEDNYVKGPNGVPVRKWGEKDPTIGDEVFGHVGGSFFNIIGNLIAAPIHSINPSLAKFKFKPNQIDSTQIQSLSYYTINYQQNTTYGQLPPLKP